MENGCNSREESIWVGLGRGSPWRTLTRPHYSDGCQIPEKKNSPIQSLPLFSGYFHSLREGVLNVLRELEFSDICNEILSLTRKRRQISGFMSSMDIFS
jgi:hypothetical protein